MVKGVCDGNAHCCIRVFLRGLIYKVSGKESQGTIKNAYGLLLIKLLYTSRLMMLGTKVVIGYRYNIYQER